MEYRYIYISSDCSYFFQCWMFHWENNKSPTKQTQKISGCLPEVRMSSAPASRAQRAALGRRWALQLSLPAGGKKGDCRIHKQNPLWR